MTGSPAAAGAPTADRPRPFLRWVRAGAVFVAALALNLATAAPDVVEGDGAELQTLAAIGGVAHPTGYPTYILLGRVFTAVWPGPPAFRATAMCAVLGAAALAVLLLMLESWGTSAAEALAGVVLVGSGVTFRWASIYPEVYALAVLLFVIALWTSLGALSDPTRGVFVPAALLGLAVTGHFAFAPAAAILGLALLLRAPRDPASLVRRALALAGGTLVGLSPYLYLAWADAARLPINYLRTVVEPASGMFGLTPASFDQPWERLSWLVLGRESRPYAYYAHPRLFVANGVEALARELLFEVGPALVVLAPIGAWSLARRRQGVVPILLAIGFGSLLLAVSLVTGKMLLVFLLPLTLVLGILGALGCGALAAAVARNPWARGLLTLGLAVSAAAMPHAIRVQADRSPIHGWSHLVEGGPEVRGPLPRFDRLREPRATAERALAVIPESSLVIARWRELGTLWYLREVEGRRRDVTLDPVYVPGHIPRYERAQREHAVRERPIVLLGRSPELEPYLGARDSVAVTPHLWLYILREPLRFPGGVPSPQAIGVSSTSKRPGRRR